MIGNDSDMPKVAIIDYGMGNLFSVKRACENVGLMPLITSAANELLSADAAILPGVGAFGDAMGYLAERDLVDAIKEFITSGKQFMGVCLGMQLLFSESEEFGLHRGLGVIQGRVVKFPGNNSSGEKIKVPQVCWNAINRRSTAEKDIWMNSPLVGVRNGDPMYFVHSFYVEPLESDRILSITDYEGIVYCSSIQQENVFACQFHPEKSGLEGIKIYRNWANKIIEKGAE